MHAICFKLAKKNKKKTKKNAHTYIVHCPSFYFVDSQQVNSGWQGFLRVPHVISWDITKKGEKTQNSLFVAIDM